MVVPESEAELFAFVDESGNHDLDIKKLGASDLYVCAAVIVDGKQKPAVENRLDEIASAHFGGAEIKSSRIGSDHTRRLRVLTRVCGVDFGYFAIVVDKGRIRQDSGLRFKPSFFKFLSRMLYRRLCATGIESLTVEADQFGGRAFMNSFRPYLIRNGFPDLYTDFSHRFVDSRNSRMVQLADLIAGSLSYVYDPEKKTAHSSQFLKLLRPKQMGVSSWPPGSGVASSDTSQEGHPWDEKIRRSTLNGVQAFENEYGDDSSEDRQMQGAVLRHLLFLREFGADGVEESATAERLIEHLRGLGFPQLTNQSFSSRVIGPLRDHGLVLAGGNEGFRVAMDLADIRIYLDHDKRIICPMLHRLSRARQVLKINTANRVDILDGPEYSALRALVETYESAPLENLGEGGSSDPDV